MIFKYVRDKKNRKIGVIVALDKDKIGWSLKHKKDKWNKDKGLGIAIGRANVGSNEVLPTEIFAPFNHMVDRAERFFK